MSRGLFPEPAIAIAGYARIAVERGVDEPRGLTYAIPQHLSDLAAGERVVVPLGRGGRDVEGYVIAVAGPDSVPEGLAPAKIKAIRERAGSKIAAALPPGLVELARWMDRYYCCPLGMVLGAMVPAAVKKGSGGRTREVLRPTGAEPAVKLPPATRAAWEGIGALEAKPTVFAKVGRPVAEWGGWPVTRKQLRDALGLKSTGPIARLVELGLLEEHPLDTVRASREMAAVAIEHGAAEDAPVGATGVRLNSAQEEAVQCIAGGLGDFAVSLLFGVTGSGKTEVYLRAIERVLERGEGAIVLVPEIMLTPQTAGRFTARFGRDRVALLHSGLTATQRHQQWARVATGEAHVVVGARSALFAPFSGEAGEGGARRLGLIVVDEEHDSSYKQDQLPRYHARNVAIKRAQIEGCPVVLGSATPSLESWHNARAGRFALLELPERVGGGVLPRVEIVNLNDERKASPALGRGDAAIGPRLTQALAETLDAGGQVMLLLNRRGFASSVVCSAACGWKLDCAHCDAAMVCHRSKSPRPGRAAERLRCHHCHAEAVMPRACPVCGKAVILLGFGTQRLEDELARLHPELEAARAVLRLDADTMRLADDYADALRRFASGEARVLLGTQMIAKGLDFPNVRLIGVVQADTSLAIPDFRAAERTFQLVAQVAGRAGRSEASAASARVLVQTLSPNEPALERAAAHDYVGFAEGELALRRDIGLPPVRRMVRVTYRHTSFEKAMGSAQATVEAVREVARGERLPVELAAEEPIRLDRLADHHRVAVDLLAGNADALGRVLAALRRRGLVKADAGCAVDVDPIALR